eukprot:gene1106-1691_t
MSQQPCDTEALPTNERSASRRRHGAGRPLTGVDRAAAHDRESTYPCAAVSVHASAIPMLSRLLRTQRPSRYSGLRWDMRIQGNPDDMKTTACGLPFPRRTLRQLDYAFRVAVLVVLPVVLLAYNVETTKSFFVFPAAAFFYALAVPQTTVGATIRSVQQILALLLWIQVYAYALVALDPYRIHVAMWFAVYIVFTIVTAFLTEGIVMKLTLYSFNIVMVGLYNGEFPTGISGYEFVWRFTLQNLVAAAIGTLPAFILYPCTDGDATRHSLRFLFDGLSILFSGCCSSMWLRGDHPEVERRVNTNRILAVRAEMGRRLEKLKKSVELMRYEWHGAHIHNRVHDRILIFEEALSSMDGMINVLKSVAWTPAQIDASPQARRWGELTNGPLVMSGDFVEEACSLLGDLDHRITPEDTGRIDHVRQLMQGALDDARRTIFFEDPPDDGAAAFPFLTIGFFNYNFGCFLRTIDSYPDERNRPGKKDRNNTVKKAAAAVSVTGEAPSSVPEDVATIAITYVPPANTEPLWKRGLLHWPRSFRGILTRVPDVLHDRRDARVRLREAVKLCFAMVAVLIVFIALDEEFPAQGAAVLAYVKDINVASTVSTCFGFLGATIGGSLYGLLASSLATSEAERITYICLITLVCSFIRYYPPNAYVGFLGTLLAVTTLAPGIPDPSGVMRTVQTNVAAVSWYILLNVVLWPIWPSQQVDLMVNAFVIDLRGVLGDLFSAFDDSIAAEKSTAVLDAAPRLQAALMKIRGIAALAATEPTLQEVPVRHREVLRVVDALEAISTLVYPVASAIRFLL